MTISLVRAITLFAAVGTLGCSTKLYQPADTVPTIPTESCLLGGVSVSPATVNMNVRERLQLSAVSRACLGAPPAKVTWTSSDTLIVTVDSTGWIQSKKVGSASVIAKLVADPTVQGAAAILVVTPVSATQAVP